MHRKTCTRCGKDSYSAASGNGEWKCPYCNKDLASEPATTDVMDATDNKHGA